MISMWNIFQALNVKDKHHMIQEGLPTIRFIRLLVPTELNPDTAYIAKSEEYFYSSNDCVLIVHRQDMIIIPHADVSEIFNQASNQLEEMIRWDEKLEQYESDPDGIQKMLESALKYMYGAFYIYAFGGKTLGLAPTEPSQNSFWNAIIKSPDMSYERMDLLDQVVDFSELDSDPAPTLRESRDGSLLYMHCNIMAGTRIVAHMLYFSFSAQVNRGIEVYLQRLADHITLCFFKHFENINIGDYSASMLLKLCEDNGRIAADVQNYFRSIGWNPKAACQCLGVYCGPKDRTIRLTNMVKLTRSIFTQTIICFLDNYLIALINLQPEKEYEKQLKIFLEKITDDYTCGISQVFHGLEKVYLYSRQAIIEVERCQQLETNICYANQHDTDYYRLMFLNAPIGECYINRSLLQLVEFDQRNNTDYYITMKAYLFSYFHISDAAKMLNVHRNTFIYRMSRIREIIDFSEFDQTMQNNNMENLSSYHLSIFYIDQLFYSR